MEARKGRQADRALRPAMRSPGRQPVGRREHRERFWEGIAGGLSSEDADVAPVVGSRWFRENGGMAPFSLGLIYDPTHANGVSFWFRFGGMGGVAGRLTASGNDHTDAGFGFCHRRSRWLVLPKGLGSLFV